MEILASYSFPLARPSTADDAGREVFGIDLVSLKLNLSFSSFNLTSYEERSEASNLDCRQGQEEGKVIVAVKQGNVLGTAFHPELTADTRW